MMSNETPPGPANENDLPERNAAAHDEFTADLQATNDAPHAQLDGAAGLSPSPAVGDTDPVVDSGADAGEATVDDVEDDYQGLFPWEIEAKQAEKELSPEERARKAEHDRLLLTHYGIFYSVVSITALGLAEGLGIPGADSFLRGLMVGCPMAVLNLHLLAKACWGVLTGQRGMGSLAGFGLSFTLLMASAFWLVRHHPNWILGFGFGLTLPILVGFSYALHLRKEAKKVR